METETKRLIIGVALVMTLVIAWMAAVNYLFPILYQKNGWVTPQQRVATQPPPAPPAPAPAAPVEAAGGAGQTQAPAAVASSAPAGLTLKRTAPSAQTVTLGSTKWKDPRYVMGLVISNRGAGLQEAVLNQFRKAPQGIQQPAGDEPYVFQEPLPDGQQALATRSIILNGTALDLTDALWRVENQTTDSVIMAIDVAGPRGPLARIRKTFQVSDANSPSLGYEALVNYSIQSLSAEPLIVQTRFDGTNTPPREVRTTGADRQIIAGYNSEDDITLVQRAVESFASQKASQDLVKSDKGLPMVWAGACSVYFDAIVLPEPLEKGKAIAGYLSHVTAEALNPDSIPEDRQVAMTFQTADMPVAPGKAVDIPLRVYLGPKWRQVLNTSYYSSFPRSYEKTLLVSGSCCAFLTFQPLINLLVSLLTAFHWLFGGFAGHGDWGLSIIALVVVVRLILHPITKRSTISMQKMGKMGPEMERLKKKYGDNKDELNKAMMSFYKEQGVTPILGCLPMFLQMPIWIALWQALQATFELRQAPFLWGWTWIHDLAQPDALIRFAQPIPLPFVSWHLYSINVLPILMMGVTYLQQKFQPKPLATTPEQEQQQKMMVWMTLIIPLMFYNMPSGLNLYYVTSMGLGILESKRIRDHLRAQEEAEKAGRVFVDTKPTRQGKKRRDEPQGDKKAGGGLFGWLAQRMAQLQDRAEQLRHEQEKRPRK